MTEQELYAKQLEDYFYHDAPKQDWMNETVEEREFVFKLIYELIRDKRDDKQLDTERVVGLLADFSDKRDDDPITLITQFFNETRGNDAAGAFLSDAILTAGLKNKYLFEIIEMLRFAQMQKQNLSDAQSYNRHIEKSLADMKTALIVLFELETSYAELESILHKYYELTANVNSAKYWTRFYSLSRYSVFEHFLHELKSELNATFLRGGLKTEALKYYLETQEETALEAYMKTLMETAVDNRSHTDAMISCNVAFPYEDEFLLNTVALFAEDTDRKAALEYMLHQPNTAADNVIALLYGSKIREATQQEKTLIEKHGTPEYETRNWIVD